MLFLAIIAYDSLSYYASRGQPLYGWLNMASCMILHDLYHGSVPTRGACVKRIQSILRRQESIASK